MAYDQNAWYRFTDKDGNEFVSRGDNGYVWQSITEGIPISVDSNGNWYTEPYLDVEQDGYVAHIPNWFKATNEYNDWQKYASQIPNLSVNKEVFQNLNSILKSLGAQGAMRTSLTKDIQSYGVKNQELVDKYVKDIVNMAAEGQGGGNAKITLWGTEYDSAADVARHYKELSKESLSKAMTSMYDIMDKGSRGEWNDKEEYLADAVTAAKILNYIDDNHISYGNDDEFNGLLASSAWQQINRGMTQFMGGISTNTFVGIPARVAYGALESSQGRDFSLKIEDLYNKRLATGSDLGAGLEGNDAADVVGMWGGAIGSIAVTMAASMMLGSTINAKVATSAPGGFWNSVGNFAQTIPGAAISDFFLNDVPLDLMIFATDAMRDGIGKAWFDPENPQPLFGLPFIRQSQDGNFYPSGVGPDVPGGLAMNMIGDAVLDAAIPFLGIVGNSVYKGLDDMTGGGVTRVREKAALFNLQVQEKITGIPVLGTGWQKFVNYMMGAENAQFIREARKAAIAEGSMEPYVRAQNLLTLSNHSGMEVVHPLYKQLDEELGISKTLKDFNKKAKELGGVGETRVEWKEIKKGRSELMYKVVPDTIPKDVKQTLLDVERLSELNGEIKKEGGLIPNPARSKEIAEIEARLEKTPQELKDFADTFSELNKRVEAMSVDLGVTKQEWIDALALDPRWEKYMTRQALVPGSYGVAGGTNPPDAKILTAKRKGYYADNYIDPTLALGMKVEALGRAFAWNERAKAMVAFEVSQGKIVAGKAGVDTAARLAEVKQQIKQGTEFRKAIGYDEQLGGIRTDTESISNAFRKINDLLNLPEQLSLKSVYEATQNPRIKEFISEFNRGKIQFADGVKEAAGLSDSDAAAIIQNTYLRKGDNVKVVTENKSESNDNIMLFDDAMRGPDKTIKIGNENAEDIHESVRKRISETPEERDKRISDWLNEFFNRKNSIKDIRNDSGEIDIGIYGLTPVARERFDAESEKFRLSADADKKKVIKEIDKEISTLEKQKDKWWDERYSATRAAELEARKKGEKFDEKKFEEEYDKVHPDPQNIIWDLIDQKGDLSLALAGSIPDPVAMKTFGIDTRELVDSDASVPFNGLYDSSKKVKNMRDVFGNDYFQTLTRGEVRRALYTEGYEKTSGKIRADIDKADNAFTQRLTERVVSYRGETGGTARKIKVGDDLDASSWAYTAIYPQYTDTYREGLTGGKKVKGNEGYIYRYHLPAGTPVYVPTNRADTNLDWSAGGKDLTLKMTERSQNEIVLPRDMKATVVGISKEKLDNIPLFGKKVTVVDVVVDPNTGVTPKLQTQRIENGPTRTKMATDADYPGWAIDARDDGNSQKLRMLDESDPNFSREGNRRDYYRDWKGRELAVLEMRPSDYTKVMAEDGRRLAVTEGSEKAIDEYADMFESGSRAPIPYIDYGSDGRIIGQEGRHRALAADKANIEKMPVIIEYQKGTHPAILDEYADVTDQFVIRDQGAIANVPDTAGPIVQSKIESAAAKSDYNAGVTANGIPYKYTVEDGKITSFEKVESSEDYAAAISTLGGVYNISASTIDSIGKPNTEGIIRTILYYRDNMPNIGTGPTYYYDRTSGSWGYIQPANHPVYGWELVDGHIRASEYPVYLGYIYRAGNEADLYTRTKDGVDSGHWPKNTQDTESTPIHEGGHSLMVQLAVHRLNRMADEGLIELPDNPYRIGKMVDEAYEDLHNLIIDKAMKKVGYEEYTEADVTREARTISKYASSTDYGLDHTGKWKHDEIMSEAQNMYSANGANSSRFCIAIVEAQKEESARFANAAAPAEVFTKNNLTAPKGLFKDDGQYAFPVKEKIVEKTEPFIPTPLLGQDKPVSFHDNLFHGSGKSKTEVYTVSQVPILGEGKYWAFSESNAKYFGDKVETGYVSLKNPLDITKDDDWRELTKQAGWKFPNPTGLDEATVAKDTANLRRIVTEAGYDGIVVRMSPTEDTSLLFDVFGIPQVVDYGVELKTKVVSKEKVDTFSTEQKAKWLDKWRQKNPYLKGKGVFTEQDYQMANLWDTYFQKEIYAYDPNSKTAMPDLLSQKNGDFLENLASNAAKKMVAEIKEASIEGFDERLATMALSRNSSDIASAMDDFIIGRINKSAEEIAAKMAGGKTEDNLATARMTLWSDDSVKNDFIILVSSLSPDIDSGNINSKITELFDTQAKGFASVEALPIDTKELISERNKLTEKLYKENKYARAKGKEVDKNLKDYVGDVTQTIHYKEGGEDVYVVVSDPVIAEVLKKPNNYQETGVVAESLANAANFISRAYRLGTTGANPIAFVRNVLRDPMQAAIQGGFNPLRMTLSPEAFYGTLRNFGLDDATIKNVTERLANWAGASGQTAEMRNMGITTPGSVGYRNRVEKVSKKINKIGDMKIIEKAEAPLETWETMFRNQIAQQSFVKNYERFGDVNRAMGMAMFDASNSTTNFSHSVGLFKRATSTVPYLSSAINGTRSFWVMFNMDPVGMMTRITAGFMVPAMAITAWNLSSQERRDQYMNLPEWYKDGHLILIDLEGNAISFPIPEELGQYYGTARRLMEYTQEATPYSIGQIMAKGAFGFLPVDTDGYFSADGTIDFERGTAQMFSGLIPQAATAIYEFVKEKDLFTGADLSNYTAFQKWLNLGTNIFGTGFKTLVNDIGTLIGVPQKELLGKNTADTLARDLFGVGFDNAKNEFMSLVGNPSEVDPVTGKESEATGLFKENERLQKEIENINAQIAYSSEDKKAELEKMKEDKIQAFTDKVTNLVNKYMSLYTQTGGLEEWQKEKLVKLLTLGRASSSASSDSYQSGDMSDAYLNERSLAQNRYVQAGLPAGPSLEALGDNGSIELQAAINRFYGVNKQATQDFENAIKAAGAKDVKDEFYSVINKIYDAAEEQGKDPDYDLIEKIQARYLQMMDAALVPLINQYGINVLNNTDFIDAVRKQVSGMIPSDDWRQSTKNAKRFLSTKEFPTATVDVKKWLKQRYTSGMRNRNIDSDAEVTERLDSIRADIDAGRMGAAKGKIDDLKKGVNKANFYISSKDLMTLNELNNMVK